jgi:succinate-semialdehyde dehydrogenase/glutarate-semialdehyde dehydrogenase
MDRVNPTTGRTLEPVEEHTAADVEEELTQASEAFDDWSDYSVHKREQLLEAVGDVLRENKREYAALMTREMGKPITAAIAEVEKCAWVCDYYAEQASEQLVDESIGCEAGVKTFTTYDPLGPILAVMPWNYPFWQVFRFATPTLTAGNVVLLKHAPNVSKCAQVIEEAFTTAGYPEGAFTSLMIDTEAVADVIRDDRIAAVTLTGSERAGRAVAETAGAEVKQTVLELGGSDPFVVFDDADIDTAAQVGAQARLQNGGQTCIAAKRFIIQESVYDEFLDRFIEEMDSWTVGNPMEEDTDIGPQAREDLLTDLHGQVQRTLDAGATLECGGKPLDCEGFYYPPTVLTDVPRDAVAACEEVFGPVAAIFQVTDDAEAIALANDTDFGLGASVWTEDLGRGEHVAREIEAGATFVNELVKSDPRLPFGGIKNSGYGRELGRYGIREFTNKKTVWIQSANDEPVYR